MGIEDGTTQFNLTRALEYSFNGRAEKADHVILKEPGMDHIKYYLRLKQIITSAQMELAKQAEEINRLRESIGEEIKPLDQMAEQIEQEAEELAPGIALALQAAQSIDIGEFIDTFAKMACLAGRKSVCMVNGHQAMTSALWANLKPDDAFDMAVWWCCFFAMPSIGGEQTLSGQPLESDTARTEV